MKNIYNGLKEGSSARRVIKVSAILIMMMVWILIDKGNIYGQSLKAKSKSINQVVESEGSDESLFKAGGGDEDGDITDEDPGSDGDNSFDVYPNPVEKDLVFDFEFTVREQEGAHFEVLDVQGKLVEQGVLEPGLSQYKIDLGDLKTGMYFARVNLGGSLLVKRIIKK